MILPITAYGTEILRSKTVEAENTPETKKLVEDMLETLANTNTGVGLAAPQVNVGKSIFLAKYGNEIKVHINPVVWKRRDKQKSLEEGCLSIPGIYKDVIGRDDIIDIVSYDINFKKQRLKLRGFESRIFQHELDHLNGILFIDHITKEGREEIADKLNEIESGKIQTHYPMFFKEGVVQKKEEEAKNGDIIKQGTDIYLTGRGKV
jgi:peptide deformylase